MAQLQLVTVKETKNLERFVATVMPLDVQRTLQYVYLSELEAQRALGNRPTQALIDNRKGGDLTLVKKRAQAFFASTGRMIEALTDAWAMLVKRTRIKTGRGRASYALYRNGRPVGGESDIARVVKAMQFGDTIQIVGPAVEYGRHLYWKPIGKPRKKRTKVAKSTRNGVTTTVYAVSVVPLHKQVMAILRRRYPELHVGDEWVKQLKHGEPIGERWPTITIWPKGTVH
jgi:hypothetical protein